MDDASEVDFLSAARLLEASPDTARVKIAPNYYELLKKNKEAFTFATTDGMPDPVSRGGRESTAQLQRLLKAATKDRRQLTDDQEGYVRKVMLRLDEGALPKQTARQALKAVNDLKGGITNVLKVLAALQASIPARLLEEHIGGRTGSRQARREVILSEYFAGS